MNIIEALFSSGRNIKNFGNRVLPFALSIFIFTLLTSALLKPNVTNAQVGALVDPVPAEALNPVTAGVQAWKSLSTVYNLWCGFKEFVDSDGQCELNANMWGQSFLMQNLVYNNITQHVCDQTMEELLESEVCIDPNATWTNATSFNNLGKGEYVRIPNGLGHIGSNTLAFLTTPNTAPIPTNLALYVDDTLGNTIFTTPAYAADGFFGSKFEEFVLESWKITRNMSLALFGAALAVVGLMIMFRTKISPQVTVSVYSVLPLIPLGLGIILLSYPIISAAFALIPPLLGLALRIGATLLVSILGGSGGSVQDISVWTVAVGALNSVIGVIGRMHVYGIGMALFLVAAIVGIVVVMFAGVLGFIKIFISLISTIILAPFVGLLSVLPGKQGLAMNLGKRVVSDVIALPLLLLLVVIGLGVMSITPDTSGESFLNGFNVINTTLEFWFVLLKGLLGISIIWKARNARKIVDGLLGVQPLFGGEDAGPKKRR